MFVELKEIKAIIIMMKISSDQTHIIINSTDILVMLILNSYGNFFLDMFIDDARNISFLRFV